MSGIFSKTLEELEWWEDNLPSGQNTKFYNKLNALLFKHNTFCQGSWFLYYETALPAATKALISFYDFDDGDVTRWIYRPRGFRVRHGHLREGFLNRHARNLGLKEIEGRRVHWGAKELWRFDGFTQRIFFWWMVVGVAVDFAYDWQTLLEKSGSCENNFTSGDVVPGLLFTLGAWQGGNYWQNIVENGLFQNVSGTFNTHSRPIQAVASIKLAGRGGPGSTTVGLRAAYISNGIPGTQETSVVVPPEGTAEVGLDLQVDACSSIGFDLRTQGFAVNMVHGTAYAVEYSSWNR